MWRTLRDLLRTTVEFAVGAGLTGIVLVIALLSYFSPYPPLDIYVAPLDEPPGWPHVFGTTSRGQDVFWQLSVAIRNTLLFGIAVAVMSRIMSLLVGLVSGYKGGWIDRVLMSINDTFIVIPLLPETSPTSSDMMRLMTATAMPNSRVLRIATESCQNTSWPRLVVPNTCGQPGGSSSGAT